MGSFVDALCGKYNSNTVRRDIEWAVNDSGQVYLRDRQDWAETRAKEIAAEKERERQNWIANHRQGTLGGDDADAAF